jgi:hypothetical protein
MFVISVVILYFVFTWFKKKDLIENATFLTFLLVNIVLDWVLLIPFFGVTVPEWFTLVLPSYLVGTGTIYKLVNYFLYYNRLPNVVYNLLPIFNHPVHLKTDWL